MKARFVAFLVLITSLALVCSTLHAAPPWTAVQFSADSIYRLQGEPPQKGRYYMGTEAIRMEGMSGAESPFYVTIHNFKTYTSWFINDSERMYMEIVSDPESYEEEYGSPDRICGPGERATRIGRETLQGRSTVKWTCEGPEIGTQTVWFDEGLKTIIRSKDRYGEFELTNIREGRQPASLFQLPTGYTKVTLQDMFGIQMPSLTPQATDPAPVQRREPAPAPPATQEERAEEKSGAEDLIRGVREGLKGILGR